MELKQVFDHFIEANSRKRIVENPAAVISGVRLWANQNTELTDLILKLILKNDYEIPNGEEENRLRELIENCFIRDWKHGAAAEHLIPIRDQILAHPKKANILLKLYEILNSQNILLANSEEVQVLQASGLVVVEKEQLKIHNDIYKAVFDQNWIVAELNAMNASAPSTLPERFQGLQPYLNTRSLSIATVSALSLILIFWGGRSWFSGRNDSPRNDSLAGDLSELSVNTLAKEKVSFGEEILIDKEELGEENPNFRNAKENGVEAFASQDYESALEYFEQALSYYKNAPETLIYMNNALSYTGSGFNASEKSYLIAVTVPITGELSDLASAQAMLRGVAQAQHQVNQEGGINGVPLQIVIVDDFGDEVKASEVATEIGNLSDVLGVVGHFYSGVTIGAADVYKEQTLPIIALSTSVEISRLDNEYIFRTSPSDAVLGKRLANYMLNESGQARVAVFYNSDNPYSTSLKGEFTSTVLSLGGDVVREFDWSASTFDIRQAFKQAVEADAEVLMLVPFNFNELKEKGFPLARLNFENDVPLGLMGGDTLYSAEVLTEEFEGTVVGALWHLGAHEGSDFVTQSQQLWNSEINWITAMAYDATQAWIEALKRSESNPTRTGLQQILASTDFSASGATDDIYFTQTGDRNTSVQLVEVDLSSGGYRFNPILHEEQ